MTLHKFPHNILVVVFLGSILLLQSQPIANADDTLSTPTNSVSPLEEAPPNLEEVSLFLQLAHTINASYTFLDVGVEHATLDDLADRVHNTLASPDSLGDSAPRIEVRGVNPVRLTFAVKGWTVGDTLSSSGLLGAVTLWVCPDHLLLAPQSALTPQELADLKDGKLLEWKPRSDTNGSLLLSFGGRKKLLSFVANELRTLNPQFVELFKVKPTPKISSLVQLSGTPITLGQLSPTSQAILLQLVYGYNDMLFHRYHDMFLEVDSSALVGITPNNGGVIRIEQGKEGSMEWGLIQNSNGASTSRPNPQHSAPLRPPALDLSVGKS
ncbi:hypothetical protein IAD21_01310 [Abditibacteriota bacterium]|nr:hypothetical protein IAD21_01310 [Abditibacteriota bacterium]